MYKSQELEFRKIWVKKIQWLTSYVNFRFLEGVCLTKNLGKFEHFLAPDIK